jgi:hypothetical protein
MAAGTMAKMIRPTLFIATIPKRPATIFYKNQAKNM